MTSSPAPTWSQVIATFPAAARPRLDALRQGGGMVPAADVEALCAILKMDIGQLMMALLPIASLYARVPISDYHVGAVALGQPIGHWGNLYFGANVEFAGEALSFVVHGEQSATTNAWLHGEQGLQTLAISAAPCGYCRQFLYELVTAATLTILLPASSGGGYTTTPFTTFLPDPFGPHDLGVTGGLMDPSHQGHALVLEDPDPLVQLALGAAKASYAPYTCGFAGCAVETADGRQYAGRYAENAAYNPSVSPLESALTWMNMTRPLDAPQEIRRAVLVELASKTSQRAATAAVLASVAPGIRLEVRHASLTGKNPCAG